VPGAPAPSNGGFGSNVSVFLRGANSDQVLFMVDGVRLNDANTDYAVYLGGASLGATDTIEIARGPQSTLYGGEAVGGVISIQAQKGSGAPSASISVGGGSFDTVSGAVNTQGSLDSVDWSISASGEHTANDRQNNNSDTGNLVLRVDRDLTGGIDLGATVRGFEGRYGDPSDIYTNDLYAHEREDNWLGTVFADFKAAPDWTAHVTVGGQDRRYVAFDELPGVYTSTTTVQNRRAVIDAQTSYGGFQGQRITVGVSAEDETTRNDGYGAVDKRQSLFAAFAEDEWHPVESVYLTGGVRYDDFDTFGNAVTGRGTAAWLTPDRSLKLRASYGTGFNSPSFLELYGAASGYLGNPNLEPESSRGGDAGIDWYLPGNDGTISATWFRTDYRNLIDYNFYVYPGTTENIGQARTQGVELEGKFVLTCGVELHVTYTYLDADDITDGTRLLRRPRNSGSADLWKDLGHGVSAGAGVQMVADRQDVDALTYLTINDPNYTVARVYGEWRVSPALALKARIENALNEHYQTVNGYPGLGFGAFGGLEWKL
jgi:vitamin B12 transporter